MRDRLTIFRAMLNPPPELIEAYDAERIELLAQDVEDSIRALDAVARSMGEAGTWGV